MIVYFFLVITLYKWESYLNSSFVLNFTTVHSFSWRYGISFYEKYTCVHTQPQFIYPFIAIMRVSSPGHFKQHCHVYFYIISRYTSACIPVGCIPSRNLCSYSLRWAHLVLSDTVPHCGTLLFIRH